jgi:hypothetical protein
MAAVGGLERRDKGRPPRRRETGRAVERAEAGKPGADGPEHAVGDSMPSESNVFATESGDRQRFGQIAVGFTEYLRATLSAFLRLARVPCTASATRRL